MTAAPLRLGIAGLGTVGVGVLKMIQKNAVLITQRTGREVTVSAVCAQSRDKDRGVDLSGYAWEDDPVVLAKRDDVDVFVELIGGSTGPAKQATQAAIAAGKDVITANKAMLAEHGHSLALSAEAAGRVIRYEAAVAGGIPVVKALTEGLAGNEVQRVLGVMNGSCNYILTRMEDAGLTYEEVFAEADGLGYLEADPNLDVGGIDAAHKLAILASIAFGTEVDFASVVIEGIGAITIEDIRAAADMGYRVKLLGVAQKTGRGLEQRMTPCLVPANSPLGQLQGGTNMVILEGGDVGQIVLRGAGAGEGVHGEDEETKGYERGRERAEVLRRHAARGAGQGGRGHRGDHVSGSLVARGAGAINNQTDIFTTIRRLTPSSASAAWAR